MISVIVTAYNVEAYLRQCLESLLCQTRKDLEIVVIDDGSTDGSGSICDEFADDRVRVFHTEHRGVSEARNRGVMEARGEYLGFVDSDDHLEPDMFEVLLADLLNTGSDISVCGFYDENTPRKSEKLVPGVYEDADGLRALIQGKINNQVWNKLYRKSLFEGVSFPSGKLYEDIAVMHEIVGRARKVSVLGAKKYHYCKRPGSLTRSNRASDLTDYVDAFIRRYRFVEEQFPDIFAVEKPELLRYVAKGFSRLWRRWYGCPSDERALYRSRINEYVEFSRANLPSRGLKSWPFYMKLTTACSHSRSGVWFAVLYFFCIIYGKMRRVKSVKRKLRKLLPKSSATFLKKIVRSLRRLRCKTDMLFSRGSLQYSCPCCGSRVRSFMDGRFYDRPDRYDSRRYAHTVQEVLCPVCNSMPRQRILASWCDSNADMLRDSSVLYFAPEGSMMRWMKRNGVSCTTADLFEKADLHIDIEATGLSDDSYDVVVCNHVLEHVPDFRAAIREILRILRPGGTFICSFPMDPKVELLYEDGSVTSEVDRVSAFGQNDHVRLFGVGAGRFLAEGGFDVTEIRGETFPQEIMPVVGPADYDANVIFRCVKNLGKEIKE